MSRIDGLNSESCVTTWKQPQQLVFCRVIHCKPHKDKRMDADEGVVNLVRRNIWDRQCNGDQRDHELKNFVWWNFSHDIPHYLEGHHVWLQQWTCQVFQCNDLDYYQRISHDAAFKTFLHDGEDSHLFVHCSFELFSALCLLKLIVVILSFFFQSTHRFPRREYPTP